MDNNPKNHEKALQNNLEEMTKKAKYRSLIIMAYSGIAQPGIDFDEYLDFVKEITGRSYMAHQIDDLAQFNICNAAYMHSDEARAEILQYNSKISMERRDLIAKMNRQEDRLLKAAVLLIILCVIGILWVMYFLYKTGF